MAVHSCKSYLVTSKPLYAMVPRHFAPDPHRPFTTAGETSTIELEVLRGQFEGCISYRVGDGPTRTIAPGHRLHRTLCELLRVIGVDGHPIVSEYERELHEDVLAYEQERQERENSRLYNLGEPRQRWGRGARSPA